MDRDQRPEDQENLFSADEAYDDTDTAEDDLASEEERLRNGDISFRPVTLPGPEPPEKERKRGTGGTALMIVAAIVVVFLLTYVIQTFYSPAPEGTGETISAEGDSEAVAALDEAELIAAESGEEGQGVESSATFQAHAELQQRYQDLEARNSALQQEIETLRARPAAGAATGGAAAVDSERLTALEDENRRLKTDLERQQRESRSAVSRAEELVQRAEDALAEERRRTATAREEARQAAIRADTLESEKGVVDQRVETLTARVTELEEEVAQRQTEYDRLSSSTTTRLEGESEAVKQLINRHAVELERDRQLIREKDEEIRRLTDLIARLSVSETTGGSRSTSGPPSSGSTTSGSASTGSGTITPPRILSRTQPEYPVNARRLRVEGTVVLNVLVGTDGAVRQVKVVQADGGKLLSPAAVDAVQKWTFAPATRDGQPLEVWHKVSIQFAL